jgi:hypothetical protein
MGPALAVFLVALVLIPLLPLAYSDQGTYSASSTSGINYDLPYTLTNGTLVSIDVDLYTYTITSKIKAAGDGVFELKIPPELRNKFALGSFVVFVDEEEVEFRELLSCEYRTIAVAVEEGSEQIDIVGPAPLIPNMSQPPHYLSGRVNGHLYHFDVFTNSTICGWKFSPEQKTLQLQIASGNKTSISVPKDYLGGPLTLNFTSDNVEYHIDETEYGSAVMLEYPDNAEPLTVTITGATAMPEFGSVVMIVVSLAIMGALAAGRLARHRGSRVP